MGRCERRDGWTENSLEHVRAEFCLLGSGWLQKCFRHHHVEDKNINLNIDNGGRGDSEPKIKFYKSSRKAIVKAKEKKFTIVF